MSLSVQGPGASPEIIHKADYLSTVLLLYSSRFSISTVVRSHPFRSLSIYTATMQFKALATLLYAALAVANPAPAPQAGDLNALMGSIPTSVLGVLMTAIPPSVVSALANPTQAASMFQQIEQGQIPDWYNNLPDSVKAWATSAAIAELGGDVATATPAGSASTPAVTTSSASSSSETASGNSQTTSSGSSGAAPTSTSTPTSTPNAAPTGAVAVSFAGAAGLLALALAL